MRSFEATQISLCEGARCRSIRDKYYDRHLCRGDSNLFATSRVPEVKSTPNECAIIFRNKIIESTTQIKDRR
jgi:hypothetical protein